MVVRTGNIWTCGQVTYEHVEQVTYEHVGQVTYEHVAQVTYEQVDTYHINMLNK